MTATLKIRLILLSFAIQVFFVTSLFSQEYIISTEDFYHLKTEGSLAQNSITWFTQDTIGQMWFSTKDGVARYNGKQLFIYKKGLGKNAIADNFVSVIYVTKTGELWIVTQKGASKYNYEKDFFEKPRNERLYTGNITSISQDTANNLWFLDYDTQSLLSYNEKNNSIKEVFYKPERNEKIVRFFPGKKNHFWVTTDDNLFIDFNLKTETFIKHKIVSDNEYDKHPKLKSFVSFILNDKQGNIWLGTHFGFLIKYNPGTGKKERFYFRKDFSERTHYYVIYLFEDKENNIWIGTWFDGLYKLSPDRKTFVHYLPDKKNSNSLSNNIITAIFQDTAGYMWLGTEFAGINILKKNKKFFTIAHNFSYSHSLPPLPFMGVVKDHQNKIWLATDMDGLLWFHRNDYNNIHKFNFGKDGTQRIFALILAKNGNLWAGTEKGLYEINPETEKIIRHYKYEKDNYTALSGKNIISLCEDKEGNIWAGSIFGGLTKIDISKNKCVRFVYDRENPGGISNNYISSLICDVNGDIWAGTTDGLNRFNSRKGAFTVFRNDDKNPNSISADRINCLFEKDRNLWIGTEGGGLNKYDFNSKKFEHFTANDGLPSDNVKAINSTSNDLWFSTTHNLVKMNLNTFEKVVYGRSDGLQNTLYVKDYGEQELEFFEKFAFKDKEGFMYFGGLGGMYIFNPDSLPQNSFKPKVIIEKFKVNGKERKLTGNKIKLKSSENQLDISLAVLNFIQPDKNKISYYFENYDSTWHEISNTEIVKYFNIPAGIYKFYYKGANNDGIWSKPIKPITIIVLPRFYQTIWFKISLLILLIVLIIIFVVYKQIIKKQLRKKKEQLRYINSNLSDELINKINNKLLKELENEKHYLDSYLSLQKLAKIIDTKPNYLSQVINVKHNCNFRDFVNKYRIETAKKMLRETSYKIEAVAYEAGFNSLSTFNSVFKKETKLTPSQFRKKHQKNT